MKCIAAVVMVALAVVAEGSYVPSVYAHHAAPVLTHAAHHLVNPTVVQSNDHHSWAHASLAHNTLIHHAPVLAHNHWDAHHVPAAIAVNSHWDAHHVPAAVAINNHWGHHGHWDNHHHAAAVVVAPVEHSATYVAANRGAVHKAPLAGHAINQKSLNLAPAPGTL
ncbi:histidine-rich protein PFHRP-II-like [Toxorhynchites rutilus septentrionalis]|uniref:histidine-rich protein PFHRP-II-like n=1 Tax=Toxorhynchites rutilus septentrionalis TaxID=329112 RepID=UPI00247A3E5D|nr:histidine-rich protein PFHRP-II-like [Toxorhynchites rutilus septentrionalis]